MYATVEEVEFVIYATLVDPLNEVSFPIWDRVFVHIGPSIDEYELWADTLIVNGVLIEPGDTVDIAFDEEVHVSQLIHYILPEDELALEAFSRAYITPRATVNGLGGADYERVALVPETMEGEYLFEVTIPSFSSGRTVLLGGINHVELDMMQRRTSFVPEILNQITTPIILDVSTAADWGDPVDEPREDLTLFDGFMQMNLWEWLGLDFFITDNTIDLTPDFLEATLPHPTDYDLTGEVSFSGPENTSVRISGSEGFGEPLVLDRSTPDGVLRYRKPVVVSETTVYDITAELLDEDGTLLAMETESITIYVDEREEIDLRQRFSLIAVPQVIGLGESSTLYYSISNEFSLETLHVRLIDGEDGRTIFEDETFAPFEIHEGSIDKTPRIPTTYVLIVQVIGGDGTVLWEHIKQTRVIPMPNPAPDDGEETVFNLRLGSSRTEISSGETVDIYGAIDYGSFERELIAGELRVFVTDQDDHVLYSNASAMPHDIMGFAEEYTLTETTTFSIIAEGVAADGETVLSDRDSITITVIPPDEAEPIPEEERVYDIDFAIYTGETVIAPGDRVVIDAVIINTGTEEVDVVVYDAEGAIYGGMIGFLLPGAHITRPNSMTFDETTTLSFRAMAWVGGSILVFDETIDLTIIVDETLSPEPEDEEGTFGIDITLEVSDHTILQGETVDVIMSNFNTGTEAVEIAVYDLTDSEIFRVPNILAGEAFISYAYVDWRPESTATVMLRVEAMNSDGAVVATDSAAVTVTVIEPEEELATSIDMVVTPSETTVMLGESVDFVIDVTNTGDTSVDFIVAESLEGSTFAAHDIAPGGFHHEEVMGWIPERTTTIIFVARVLDSDSIVLYTDMQAVTIIVEEPIPDDDSDDGAGADDSADDSADGGADDGVDDSADDTEEDEPAGLFDEIDDGDSVEEIDSGGLSVSTTPLTMNAGSDDGAIMIIDRDDDNDDSDSQLYKNRRWFFIGVMVIILLLIILLFVLIIALSRKGKHKH